MKSTSSVCWPGVGTGPIRPGVFDILIVAPGRYISPASYLELAQRRQLPLASLDRDLRSAATALGLATLAIDTESRAASREEPMGNGSRLA